MARFQQSHDNLNGRYVGKLVGFERKNSLWIQNAHKTSPMSFQVDILVRCLMFSNYETFWKIGPSGDMSLRVTPLTLHVS